MSEHWSGEEPFNIEAINKKNLRRGIGSVVAGVLLNKNGLHTAHVDDMLMTAGALGTFVYGTRYVSGLIFEKLRLDAIPPERTFVDHMPADQLESIRDALRTDPETE